MAAIPLAAAAAVGVAATVAVAKSHRYKQDGGALVKRQRTTMQSSGAAAPRALLDLPEEDEEILTRERVERAFRAAIRAGKAHPDTLLREADTALRAQLAEEFNRLQVCSDFRPKP